MSAPTTPADLLDLKLMPAWVNEPAQPNEYSDYEGEEEQPFRRDDRGGQRGRGPRDQRSRGPRPGGGGPRGDRREPRRDGRRKPEQNRPERGGNFRPPRPEPMPRPQVAVRFLPHAPAFENVVAQIKSGAVAYSVFALARLFLEKPERYSVRLTAAEGAVLYQLGENGPVAGDQRTLENSAFAAMRDEFYSVEQTQSEPIKGNFTNVARDRISGTLLGPTNHHGYQPQLRSLYEQRYSRRMSFPDFQRQIEIVSDPAVVEQWKEQARNVTTYTAKGSEPPLTFNTLAETERHFRQHHLPTLLRSAQEFTISGVVSRQLADRALGRLIEGEWSTEIRSPSRMMQELASGLRQAGLNIFRHRRGMLFVSPIRTRVFGHERASVSASINAILEKMSGSPGINRKQLADEVAPAGSDAAEQERARRTLASDLRWLISEGYVIEFNDGALDLPRAKAPAAAQPPATVTDAASAAPTAESTESAAADGAAAPEIPATVPATSYVGEGVPPNDEALGAGEEIGMSVEQSIEPAVENSSAVEPSSAPTDAATNLPSDEIEAANPAQPAAAKPAAGEPKPTNEEAVSS